MATINITYEGDLRTISTHIKSGASMITDAPIDNNGQGRSFSPTDLVATALGTCIVTVMGIKAKSSEIDMDGATVEVTKEMVSDPKRRIGTIAVHITIPANQYSAKERKILTAAAHHCPVANSLAEGIESIVIKWLDDE